MLLDNNRLHLNRYMMAAFAVVLAMLAVGTALLLTLWSGSLLKPTPTPLFFAAVMISASWGGLGSGLFATALSTLAINYFALPPYNALNVHVDDLLRLSVFGLVAHLSNWLVEAQRRREEMLRESQAQLRLITDALPTPIAYVDASLHYRFNNQAYEDWFGVSRNDIAGEPIVSVLGETAYQTIQPRLEAVLAGEPVSFEVQMPYKDGDRYIQATYIPDFGKQGEVRGFVALVNDITQRQQALKQQAESLALIDALLAVAPIGICFFDQELRYIRINQVLAQINGLSVEQHLGQRFRELLPDMATLFEPQIQNVLDTGQPQLNVEFSGEAPGQAGRLGYWLANYYPVRGEAGQTVGVGVMVADITESKRAEQALRVAEERLRVAIKNSPITLFNQDQELRYTWIYNPAFEHQVEAVLGKRDEDLMPLDDALVVTRIKRRVLETGIGMREEVKITQQGRDWYYDITVEPQRDEAGSILGVTCAAIDISDRQAALRDRNLAEAALRKSEERYRAFVKQSTEGIWRFELETPLAIETPEDEQIQHLYEYGYLAECNQVMASMYGFERVEELVGRRIGDFLVRADPDNEEYLRAFIRSQYRLSDAESHELDRFGNSKYFSNNLVGIVEDGFLVRAWGNQRDITERKQAEDTLHFLAETSSILSASLDYEATLQSVAQIPVPRLADLCSVEILQDDGSIQRKAIAFTKSSQAEVSQQLALYIPKLDSANPIVKVIRTGKPELIPKISDSLLVAAIPEAEHLQLVRGLGLESVLIVPLIARQRILGTITMVTAQSGRRYKTDDLAVAEDLARRAALAIDNARLYREATTSRQSAEFAANRTALLQAVTAAFSEALTPAQVAEVVVNQGITALGAIAGSVVLLDDSGNSLKLAGTVGYPEELFDNWECRPGTTATPLADTVWNGEPIFLENVEAFAAHYPDLAHLPTLTSSCAFAAIPLTVEGCTIGGLGLSFASAQMFGEQDRAFMLALGQQCAQAIARAYLYEAEQRAKAQAVSEAARSTAANRIKDEFLAVLSHELRTPLNPILGWAKLLRTHKLDEAKTAYALETIERNAQLQTQLIEDLLDVSRILQGKVHLNVSLVDLVTVIEAAQETVRLAAEAKSIEISTVFDANVRKVLGDANRLQQVVWNLLSNAVKFTPSRGRVEIKLERLNNNAQIIVRDTGKGIVPEFLPHVFDYFRQENSSTTRVFGGLGLGLAIVQHLVELHGGNVTVSSAGVDQGATFTVTLPLINVVSNESEDLGLPGDEPNLEGIRVLVVDDEQDTLELIVFILEQYGASVQAVTSATEALNILVNVKPDVLLSDIGMPEMDGYMFIQQIRSLCPEQGGEIPAIALTAYAGETDHQQILLAGFQKHVTKPVEPAFLANAIATLLRGNSNLER
ncbi:PAS domain-containing protein [Microcoleus sp. FACHB-SPT15]|uniref:PAS domain-containing protein n=1 Tax=Microcoleus sp. FACHB-SPT15 TaxID=2692830 RepID=UPI00177B8741|nr:PAS domain-containing protein [Microcoleus sp. FACHB-SPT15]MBD1808744.1 PAS domain-containing protein [Microcoleus sp. FACHB-SPT15]